MIGELSIINEWIPEQMEPGTCSCWKMLAKWERRKILIGRCSPVLRAERLGLITRKQMAGLLPTICGSIECSAQFFIQR